MSHPVWVRGLKLVGLNFKIPFIWSHPVWVRGLKLSQHFGPQIDGGRTPCGCVD